jgi:hypothetical protein
MDRPASLLRHIWGLGLRLRVEGDKLLLRRRAGSLAIDRLRDIQERKAELISLLHKQSATAIPNIAPLTYWQEHHWRTIQEQGNTVPDRYMVALALLLEGTLDVGLLARCIHSLTVRHESLRTRVIEFDSIPVQQIDEPKAREFVVERVAAPPGVCVDDAAHGALLDFFSEPVDLRVGPLFKAKLFALNHNKHVLALYIHHMFTDAESLTQFFTELWRSYQRNGEGSSPEAQTDRFQFADYATWLRSDAFDWHEGFWKEKLRDAPPVIWPANEGHDPNQQSCTRSAGVVFPESFTGNLQRLARHLGTVPGLILLAAYGVFIAHWCEQTDFVIPFASNGRTSPEHAEVLGWLAYPLLIRFRVDHELAFKDFASCAIQEYMLALENADGGRLSLRSPFVSQGTFFRWATALASQDARFATHWIARDLAISQFPHQLSRPPLAFTPVALGAGMYHEGVRGAVLYRTDLFHEKRLLALMASMHATFEGLVRDPSTRIGNCAPLMSKR